jgi:hypothetical protein
MTTERRGGDTTAHYGLRYIPGTDLAHRFPTPARGRWRTREEAENVRRHCPNADRMEVIDDRTGETT